MLDSTQERKKKGSVIAVPEPNQFDTASVASVNSGQSIGRQK